MHRVEIELDERLHALLTDRAKERGVPVEAMARQILAYDLTGLASITGIGEGPEDLGLNHDRYLYGEE